MKDNDLKKDLDKLLVDMERKHEHIKEEVDSYVRESMENIFSHNEYRKMTIKIPFSRNMELPVLASNAKIPYPLDIDISYFGLERYEFTTDDYNTLCHLIANLHYGERRSYDSLLESDIDYTTYYYTIFNSILIDYPEQVKQFNFGRLISSIRTYAFRVNLRVSKSNKMYAFDEWISDTYIPQTEENMVGDPSNISHRYNGIIKTYSDVDDYVTRFREYELVEKKREEEARKIRNEFNNAVIDEYDRIGILEDHYRMIKGLPTTDEVSKTSYYKAMLISLNIIKSDSYDVELFKSKCKELKFTDKEYGFSSPYYTHIKLHSDQTLSRNSYYDNGVGVISVEDINKFWETLRTVVCSEEYFKAFFRRLNEYKNLIDDDTDNINYDSYVDSLTIEFNSIMKSYKCDYLITRDAIIYFFENDAFNRYEYIYCINNIHTESNVPELNVTTLTEYHKENYHCFLFFLVCSTLGAGALSFSNDYVLYNLIFICLALITVFNIEQLFRFYKYVKMRETLNTALTNMQINSSKINTTIKLKYSAPQFEVSVKNSKIAAYVTAAITTISLVLYFTILPIEIVGVAPLLSAVALYKVVRMRYKTEVFEKYKGSTNIVQIETKYDRDTSEYVYKLTLDNGKEVIVIGTEHMTL